MPPGSTKRQREPLRELTGSFRVCSGTCSSIITISHLGAGIAILESFWEPVPPRKPSGGTLLRVLNPNPKRAGTAGLDAGRSKRLLPVGTVTTAIMQIRVVNSRAVIATVDPEERVVYLATHPVALALLELIKRCPCMEAVELSPSKYRNMCKASWGLLEVHGVKIFEGTVQRRRADRIGYFTVDDGAIRRRPGRSGRRDWTPWRE